MVRVLIPVFIVLIIAITVLVIHKRETKVDELKELRKQNAKYKELLIDLDISAQAEYLVTSNNFAAFARDKIRKELF